MSWDRVTLLCEDRAHLDFLRELCVHLRWRVLFAHVAPPGQGDAHDWVIEQFPERLREIDSGLYPALGLLVMVDGDHQGRRQREQALDMACQKQKISRRQPTDPMALLVPTWSIDTWLLFFCKGKVIPESESAKRKAINLFRDKHPGFMAPGSDISKAPRPIKAAGRRQLVEGFLGGVSDPHLPSLDLSRVDLFRWMK